VTGMPEMQIILTMEHRGAPYVQGLVTNFNLGSCQMLSNGKQMAHSDDLKRGCADNTAT